MIHKEGNTYNLRPKSFFSSALLVTSCDHPDTFRWVILPFQPWQWRVATGPGGSVQVKLAAGKVGMEVTEFRSLSEKLGGGNSNIFWNFHPYYLGKIFTHFDGCIFFKWVGEKPPSLIKFDSC